VPASRVSGTSAKDISPPFAPPAACHSVAIASARRWRAISSLPPAGRRIGRPSSSTCHPAASPATVALSQKRFMPAYWLRRAGAGWAAA